MIVFNKKKWIANPEIYPMIRNCSLSPFVPYNPMFKYQAGGMPITVEDQSVIVERENGHYFAVPNDVYQQIKKEVI